MPAPLEIRVLGELEVVRAGKSLPLPASKKTRALLGYLVVAGGRPQPRPRLCELFWDGPDDPRAALRWSLAKVRPLVDDPKAVRIAADREHAAFEPRGAIIDLVRVREEAASVESASLEALRSAAALFRGELLEGLDLPECYRYHEWCVAEREAARRTRGGILAQLVERLAAVPDGTSPVSPGRRQHLEEALGFARARVTIDPLLEVGHITVMQLLAALGRPREAIKQYESCRRVLEGQLGRGPSRELEAARSTLGRVAATVPPEAAVRTTVQRQAPAPLVGRKAERATLASAVGEAAAGKCRHVLLLVGEPGIGKTRLLEEVADLAVGLGGGALSGRAFEAEMVRPYGAWIDVLRSAPPGAIDPSLRADLAPLLPELGAAPGDADRNRLFDGVGTLLRLRAAEAPLVVALDDIQWFDEASAALLHYVARSVAGSRVLLVCAARAVEIDGNHRVQALVRALVREGRLTRVDLAPLDADATRELVRSVDGRLDAAQVFVDAGGNPLYSLELARALIAGESGVSAHTLDGLIAERLSRLDERASELLPWAAALGHAFSIDTLAAVTSLPVRDLLAAVEELERYGVLRVASAAPGNAGYDFAHDLVRRAAYRAMSEPRRRWVHLHVARTLHAAGGDLEGALAGDIAHHAALGGDNALAARAYVAAGERCLRLFAYADAGRLAASGIQHVDRLEPEVAIRLRLSLLSVQVHSNQWLRRPQELEAELSEVTQEAGRRGMHAEAARGFYLMSFIHHERGDFAHAGARTLQAAHAGRAGDIETRQHQLANTGRCLILIERDVAHAEELLQEALSLGPGADRTSLEMTFGMGLLHAFKGESDEALPLLERSAELAAIESDHWTHAHALIAVARLALDSARPGDALARCVALEPLVAKLSEGSEGPFVAALRALARLALGDGEALSAAEAAVATLRAIDSKGQLAYALDVIAEHDAQAGRGVDAHRRAAEALAAAETVGQKSEAAVARSLLARVALDRGDRGEALAMLQACESDLAAPLELSARARAAVAAAAERVGAVMPAVESEPATVPFNER